MKKLLFLQIIYFFSINIIFAQPGSIDLSFNSIDEGIQTSNIGPNGSIFSTAIQSDGKIIIVGDFTLYNGTVCNRIARLNSNGTLDSSFNIGQGANDVIRTVNILADGKIIIGGNFTSYDGIGSRKRIARLNNDGVLDTTFGAGSYPDNTVLNASIQSDGKIVIVGDFITIGSTVRNRIARYNANGGLDTTFNPGIGADNSIRNISIQNDGKILIGGNFTNYNGTVKYGIARINSNGTLDTTFNPQTQVGADIYSISINSDGKIIVGGNISVTQSLSCLNTDGTFDNTFNPGLNNRVLTTSIQSDGKIIVGGDFTFYNGTQRNRIARLNANGGLDTTFNPGSGSGANNSVRNIIIQNDGKIIIGGSFNYYTFNGNFRNGIARLNTNGILDDVEFCQMSGANNIVRTASIQTDGKIIIGGEFTNYNGVVRNGIARLNIDGSIDTSFNPGLNDRVFTTSIQSDGKIIVGGAFTSLNGNVCNRMVRLNSDGTLDSSFNIGTGFSNNVWTTLIQDDGKILVGGIFAEYNGVVRNGIARLNSNGTLDTTFTALAAQVTSISSLNDGKYIVGSRTSPYIRRFNSNGTNDTSFNFNLGTGLNGSVETTSIQSDGKIIVGGLFTAFNGWQHRGIIRINSDGTIDSNFLTGLNGSVFTICIQSDGKIIIGGDFTTYGSTVTNRFTRLNSDGSLDTNFNLGEIGANSRVYCSKIQSDGKIIIGGDFTSYNTTGRNRIARINGGNALSSIGFENNGLKIYPNPSKGIYTIKTNEMNATKSISIYTILGQKIYDTLILSNETTIDISNQPKGIYLYTALGYNGEIKSGKLVIE